MNRFRFLYNYLKHFITAWNTGGFGVHSPFVYQFTRYVLYEKHYFYVFSSIEEIRKKLKKDNRLLDIKDFGTGTDRKELVKDTVSRSVKSAKYGQLLFRMVHYFKSILILELGTSLGLTTSYLAASSSKIKCVSIEGSSEIAGIAQENFNNLGLTNIRLKVGNINEILISELDKMERLDMIFIDANHKSNAVLSYFETCLPKVHKDTVLVIDDIYWSKDMESAWTEIKNHPKVTATIDLFQLGIVFFNTDLHTKHYKMRY